MTTSYAGSHINRGRFGPSRLGFIIFAFVPAIFLFFPPLLFYKLPMTLYLYDRTVLVAARDVWIAAAAAAAWFVIAIGIVAWPMKRASGPRAWSLPALGSAFVWFSGAGNAVSIGSSLCAPPRSLSELAHWAAFAPVVAVVLGVELYRRGRTGTRLPLGTRWLWALGVLDLCVVLLLPLALARVEPAAVAVIAILYGLWALRIPARPLVLSALALCCLVAIALPAKEFVRAALYRGQPFVTRACLAVTRTTPPPVTNRIGTAIRNLPHLVAVTTPETFGLRWRTLRGPLGYAEYAAARAVNRLNRLGDFARAVETTPSQIPYARGATYRPIPGIVVPRALWPSKPPNGGGGQFYGHRYGYLDPKDDTHSVNLPVVTEGWVNYGWPGVLLSAAVVGLVLRLIWQIWIGETNAPGNVMIGMAILITAVDQESSLGLLLGGIIHALVIYGILDFLLRRVSRPRWRAQSESPPEPV